MATYIEVCYPRVSYEEKSYNHDFLLPTVYNCRLNLPSFIPDII